MVEAPRSLLDGVAESAAATLGIANVRHRSAAPDRPRLRWLADVIFAGVEENWRAANASANLWRSAANWRWWQPQTAISAHNTSPEVVFERHVAVAAARSGDRRWANQVPIASGLVGSGERRRAIDLVERRGERHFAFIELKIASDTPLFATVEVLGYAAIWLLSRRSTTHSPILAADRVDLCVLAPAAFYRPYDVAALEEAVDESVARIGREQAVALSFRFDVLERDVGAAALPDEILLERLTERPPLLDRHLPPPPAAESRLLPGVPEELVLAALAAAPGNEIGSGKLDHPQSSAALAVNGFGWFIERLEELPPLPGLEDLDWAARCVSLEQEMRFPWAGGRHPWLDAVVDTDTHVIGVESKRFEPFRDARSPVFSAAFDRDVWRGGLEPYAVMRDRLRRDPGLYRHLDAAQLVKHALGLATQAMADSQDAVLVYLYSEPAQVDRAMLHRHRAEIDDFAATVGHAGLRFAACSWRKWLARFSGEARSHAHRLIKAFAP